MATEGQSAQPTQETLLGKKYIQLLSYIAELDRIRTTTVTSVDEHPERIDLSSIPVHPSVSWNNNEPTAFLVVTRCSMPNPPQCPSDLRDWIIHEPNQVMVEPSPKASIFFNEKELFWAEDGPIAAWESWIQLWNLWAAEARPAYAARDLYARLYDLHAMLERSSDQLELVAADVAVALKYVDHPILINSLRIDLDVERSRITVGCQDEPSQVYGDAIRSILPAASESIARARKEASENADIWAFGDNEVDLFATRFVQGASAEGQFVKGQFNRDQLSARRSPWILLRKRATGLAELADGLIAKFKDDGEIPLPIQPILVDRPDADQQDSDYRGEPDEDEQSYFTKPANAEQLAILRNFRRSGCVHVQGPPGTGKTHTIANLIGHFLAEGKSVLVTSEKAQALTVLREKVVEELRPLCVSLVGSDAGEGFKAGMRGLYERLGSTEPSLLNSEAERLAKARQRTIQGLRDARRTMREIIEREHLPIEVRGWRGSPSAAGKYVNEQKASSGWIPSRILAESEPPLTELEFKELLDLLAQYSGDVVPEVRKPLPPASELLSPSMFRKLVDGLKAAEMAELPIPESSVRDLESLNGEAEAAGELLREIDAAVNRFNELAPSYRELANRVAETPSLIGMWESWIQRGERLLEKEQQLAAQAAPYGFAISGETHTILESAKLLLHHVVKTGRSVTKPRILNRQDKILFTSVDSKRQLGDEESLTALIDRLEFDDERNRFRDEVKSAAISNGLESLSTGESERYLLRDSALQVALTWSNTMCSSIVERLPKELGAEGLASHLPDRLSGSGPTERMAWWLEMVVRPVLVRYLHYRTVADLTDQLVTFSSKAEKWLQEEPSKPLAGLSAAVLSRDVESYETAFQDVAALRSATEPVQRRDRLLEILRAQAETFALSLEAGEFQVASIQGTLDSAWTYALIDQELCRRNSLNLQDTKEELDRLKHQLDEITVKLASARAWAAQHKRVTQPVRSALTRFHEAQRRLGGHQGRRVPEFLRAMRSAMREAKDAFPVWIMPLHDLAKSFDFTKTRFDVVIVDESSQLSAVGLITLLIADSAIVVGDDEQTEPSLAGVSVDSVLALVREHLVDFSDRILWSPDSSLYSFAGRFGSTVGLREHFRCVPEIISFSSKLCYQGKIQALRESKGVLQVPHVVPISCVSVASRAGTDANEAEAAEIASLIISCKEMPEYEEQTFGVIALRGSADSRGVDRQSERVVSLLRSALGASEWEKFAAKSRFKTGVPPSFQGDERDVVFVSVGDDPSIERRGRTGPLTLLSEGTIPGGQYRKRINVALSRARNQVWVVHSFRHFEAELKDGDIRRKLLEFAYAPKEWLESMLAINPKSESPFEQAVYADLVRLGFSVVPQVPVGQYRIDLVAEDSDARVAIECDGDAYHQDAAADLSRQIVLERCGWKFVRVRGSEYYRDPEGAIRRIVLELARFGVSPNSNQPMVSEPEGALLQRVRTRANEIRADVFAERTITVVNSTPVITPSVDLKATDVCLPTSIFEVATDLSDATESDDLAGFERSLFESEGDAERYQTAPATAPMPTAKSALHADEYIVFTGRNFKDPKIATQPEIEADLQKIIETEGPATQATIIERYRVATGYGRFKGPTRELVEAALKRAASSGLVRSLPDYPGAEELIYLLPGQAEVWVRRRGPRDLSDVPMGELVAQAVTLMAMARPSNDEQVLRSMLDFLDLKRLTEQARARLGTAIELARATELIRSEI